MALAETLNDLLEHPRVYIAPLNPTSEQRTLEAFSLTLDAQIWTRANLLDRFHRAGVVVSGQVLVGLGVNYQGNTRLDAVASVPAINGKVDEAGDITIHHRDKHFFRANPFGDGEHVYESTHPWDGMRIPNPSKEIMNPASRMFIVYEEIVEMWDTIPLEGSIVDPI